MDAAISSPAPGELPEEQTIYLQFAESAQETLRLSAALTGFFLKADMEQAHRTAYGAYIKRRIRSAATALIEQEDTDKLAQLAALGWIDQRLIDEFLQAAQVQKKLAALVCLLRLKKEYFGFHDRDFSL